MEHLRKENLGTAFNLLKKAKDLLSEFGITDSPLQSITLNNLGCYYKSVGKISLSLTYFIKASEIKLTRPKDTCNIAGTHLNICAIKSQMMKH